MSEEEKKAIEYLKRHIIPVHGKKGNIEYMINDVLLNLIEKQEKEIDRLQNIKRKDIQDLINNENENIYKNYISKDEIRKKLDKKREEIKENCLVNGLSPDKAIYKKMYKLQWLTLSRKNY